MTGGSNIAVLKTALAAAEARAANAEAKVSDAAAEIAFLRLTIEKLKAPAWRSSPAIPRRQTQPEIPRGLRRMLTHSRVSPCSR